jgi:asparagine synthase (glutamine-hydrolysing)
MCGLIGIGGPDRRNLVGQLLGDLAHRGPDGDGIWVSGELTLGHRRLAIIGPDDGGLQPMVSGTGRSVIVFNGEIYNYLEIADRLQAAGVRTNRRYDTAVLLDALETWGLEILPDLNGMFAFGWYRPLERQLVLARDRWGKKPLLWARLTLPPGGPAVVFSSELRTFTRLPGGPPSPDPLGIARYLVYDGMPGERTVYRAVSKVPPATYVVLSPEGAELSRRTYWHFRPVPRETDPGRAAARALGELSRAVTLRLRSDVPVGLFLSGGLDSSLLASAWRQAHPSDVIRTFTIGFEDPSYDERASARAMAQRVDAEHHEVVLTGTALDRELDAVWDHLAEPFADPSIIPTSFLCRFAHAHVKVALAGEGGDEIQAGYDPFRAWRMARVMERLLPRPAWYHALRAVERMLPADASNMSARFKVRHFAQGFLHRPDTRVQGWMASFPLPLALSAMRPELAADVEMAEVLEPTRRAFTELRGVSELHSQIHVWLRTYLESSILAKVDMAGMMHGLEVRSPFLDPGVVEAFTDLPPSLIYRQGRGKYLMRQAARPALPAAVLSKPKKGFGVPQATWLRTILRERMEAAVARSQTTGWYRHDVIAPMWRAHLDERADFRRPLWNFLFSFPFQS